MKYEFHVGDYVETVGGSIGWISHVDRNYITMESKEGFISGPWSIPEEQHHFIRIGQYDFTKPKKIQHLEVEAARSDGDVMVLWDKVNELVDIVNAMRGEKDV